MLPYITKRYHSFAELCHSVVQNTHIHDIIWIKMQSNPFRYEGFVINNFRPFEILIFSLVHTFFFSKFFFLQILDAELAPLNSKWASMAANSYQLRSKAQPSSPKTKSMAGNMMQTFKRIQDDSFSSALVLYAVKSQIAYGLNILILFWLISFLWS